jgi:hypothetical protein
MRIVVTKFFSAVCVAYFSFAPFAQAQDGGLALVQKFSSTEAHKRLVLSAFSRISPDVFQRCPTLVSKGSNIAIVQPVSADANGQPNAGIWKESFPVSGCGNDTTFHLYFVTANEKINSFVGAPGGTRANPTLQKDALFYATLGAGTFVQTCKTFNVKDTKFDNVDAVDSKVRSWRETWTMVGCNRTLDVPLQFTPDDRGTAIRQNLKEVTERK